MPPNPCHSGDSMETFVRDNLEAGLALEVAITEAAKDKRAFNDLKQRL
jgi:hypothetical protein